jgi:hypothetical protein|tara:strand:- start:215 stop:1096 length:882 start_codon:yes stop_codon:yes gene_type:complete
MKTVNSISGGKTSAYIAANYPADYNVFALVRTTDMNCLYPDKKLRQVVSDKIGTEFIGTLEDDVIIHTILDLEQFIGKEIDWVTGKPFDEIIRRGSVMKEGEGKSIYLPQANMRFCTQEMKINPIAQYCYDRELPCEMRIGFRANEMRRANTSLSKTDENGLQHFKFHIGYSKNGNKKWKELPYRRFSFPLIEDGLFKDNIEEYWKDKPVRFAWKNNCVGCMGSTPYYLKHQYKKNKNKVEWFIEQEKEGKRMGRDRTWRIDHLTYQQIIDYNEQYEMFDDDFDECDSGYCGL